MDRGAWWSTVHRFIVRQDWVTFTSLHLLSIFRSWITGSKLLSYFSVCSLDSIQSFCDLTCQRSCHSTGCLNLGCGFCIFLFTVLNYVSLTMLCGSAGEESACNAGDLGLIPGLGRYPGERKGYPLQYSHLENSVDYIVPAVTKSQTRLSEFHIHTSPPACKLPRAGIWSCSVLFMCWGQFRAHGRKVRNKYLPSEEPLWCSSS